VGGRRAGRLICVSALAAVLELAAPNPAGGVEHQSDLSRAGVWRAELARYQWRLSDAERRARAARRRLRQHFNSDRKTIIIPPTFVQYRRFPAANRGCADMLLLCGRRKRSWQPNRSRLTLRRSLAAG